MIICFKQIFKYSTHFQEVDAYSKVKPCNTRFNFIAAYLKKKKKKKEESIVCLERLPGEKSLLSKQNIAARLRLAKLNLNRSHGF